MNDEQILERGGTQEDINEYARQNGADLTKDDVEMDEKIKKFISKNWEMSKCCNARSRYEKDWGNHHDECTKCGMECEVYSTKELQDLIASPHK